MRAILFGIRLFALRPKVGRDVLLFEFSNGPLLLKQIAEPPGNQSPTTLNEAWKFERKGRCQKPGCHDKRHTDQKQRKAAEGIVIHPTRDVIQIFNEARGEDHRNMTENKYDEVR